MIDDPWPGRTPAIDLAEAVAACGYHRRDEELTDAQTALGLVARA